MQPQGTINKEKGRQKMEGRNIKHIYGNILLS